MIPRNSKHSNGSCVREPVERTGEPRVSAHVPHRLAASELRRRRWRLRVRLRIPVTVVVAVTVSATVTIVGGRYDRGFTITVAVEVAFFSRVGLPFRLGLYGIYMYYIYAV